MEFDEDRFFSGASRGDFLDALTAHAGLGSVAVLEGDEGSGVSTLLGQAVMALLDDMEVVRLDGADGHDANAVIDALLRHFNIERAALPEVLKAALAEGRLVVVIDNAEQLENAAVATMLALKQKLGARLGYLFGGLPGIAESLKGADFVVDDVLDLPALAAEDVQDFAWFVLGMELDDAASGAHAEAVSGNLGALKARLHESGESPLVATSGAVGVGAGSVEEVPEEASMRFAARQEEDDDFDDAEAGQDAEEYDEPLEEEAGATRAAPPWRHLVAVGGLLVAVVLLWAVFSGSDEVDPVPERRDLALPMPEAVGETEREPAAAEPQVQPLQPTMKPVARLEDLDNPASDDGADESPLNDAGEEGVRSAPESGVVLTPVSDPVMQSSPAAREKEMQVTQAPAANNEGEATKPESQSKPAAEATASEAMSASKPAPKASEGESGYRQADWLATLDDSRWFLQITVTSQEANARGVLDQLARKGAYYAARRNGKSVWLVLAGDYSSRQAALDAKAELPAKLRQAGPFPRKMADIRNEL